MLLRSLEERPESKPLIIQTRRRNNIPNRVFGSLGKGLFTQSEIFQSTRYADMSKIQIRKRPCGMYNCHGMTFLFRRAHLERDEDVQLVLDDDDYFEVDLINVREGDVVLYYNYFNGKKELEHSGLVVRVESFQSGRVPWVLSKWGDAGEYVHRYDYCPYPTANVCYMREGKNDEQVVSLH